MCAPAACLSLSYVLQNAGNCWKHNSSDTEIGADVHVSVIRSARRRGRKGRTRTRKRSRRKTARTRKGKVRKKKTLAAIAAIVAKVMTGIPQSLMVLSAYQTSCKGSESASEGCACRALARRQHYCKGTTPWNAPARDPGHRGRNEIMLSTSKESVQEVQQCTQLVLGGTCL